MLPNVENNSNIIHGRPDLDWYAKWPRVGLPFGVTRANKYPPYVFSIAGSSALIHKVAYVEMRWWDVGKGGDHLVRLHKPFMSAKTVCGQTFFLKATRARTCMVPSPAAIRCGRCNGFTPPFSKEGWCRKEGISKTEAHVKLGCVVEGY